MKIENRQQFLIVLTLAAVALFVGDNLIFEPLANLWSARSAQIRELRTKVNDGKLLIQREARIREPLERDAHEHAAGQHVAGRAAGAQARSTTGRARAAPRSPASCRSGKMTRRIT